MEKFSENEIIYENPNLNLISGEEGMFVKRKLIFSDCEDIEILHNSTNLEDEEIINYQFDNNELIILETIEDIFKKIPEEHFHHFLGNLNNLYCNFKLLNLPMKIFEKMEYYDNGSYNMSFSMKINTTKDNF